MRVIFLDLDGVVCIRASRYNYFDKECCDRVKSIIDKTGAKLVISSTWRRGYNLQQLKELMARGYELNMKEYIKKSDRPKIGTFDPDTVIGATPHINTERTLEDVPFGRGVEISDWLSRNSEVTKYLVLDDDIHDIKPHLEFHVHTDSGKGISDEDVLKSLKILGL